MMILCFGFFSVLGPVAGSFCKALMSSRNKLAETTSRLSVSLPSPLLLLFHPDSLLCVELKMGIVKAGL